MEVWIHDIQKRVAIKLSPNDIEELKRQGYSEAQIHGALREIEAEELQKSNSNVQNRRGVDPRQNSQLSSFATKPSEDIVRIQLEVNDILERAEHILRGDVPKFVDGHTIWDANPSPKDNPLNAKGIQEIMKILAVYINRGTFLADFKREEINLKVYDFSRAINNLIFMKDEDLGMDTHEKRKNYEMLVTMLKDIVHSAYTRALDGQGSRGLREVIHVTQSTTSQFGGTGMPQIQQQPRTRGLLNPMRWVKGKYV